MTSDQAFRHLVIYLAAVLLSISFCQAVSAQDVTSVVKGIVTDYQGQPLAGVAVKVENTKTYTETGADGHYSIKVRNPKTASLEFSLLGMLPKKVKVKGGVQSM